MSVLEQAAFMVTLFSMLATVTAAIATWFNVSISKNLLNEQSIESKRLRMPFITVRPTNWTFRIEPMPYEENEDEDEDEDEDEKNEDDDWHRNRRGYESESCTEDLEYIYQSITINNEELHYRNKALEYSSNLDIELFNIHYGVAKDIEIKCGVVNLSSFQRNWANEIESSKYKNFEIRNDDYFLNLTFNDYAEDGERFFIKDFKKKYLVMRGIESNLDREYNEKLTINLPTAFIFLLNVFILEYIINPKTRFPIPLLRIEVQCKDLLDEKHLFEINYKFKGIEYVVDYKDEVNRVSPIFEVDCKKIQ